MKVGIQIFWYQIVLCHSYCSSGSRNVWLQGNFPQNARSESLPEYSPKLEIKYLESENKYSVKKFGEIPSKNEFARAHSSNNSQKF